MSSLLLYLPTVQSARSSSGRPCYQQDGASGNRYRRRTPIAIHGDSGFDAIGLLAKKEDHSEENSSLSSSCDGPKVSDESVSQTPQHSRFRRWWNALCRNKKSSPLQNANSGRRRRTVYVLICEDDKYFVRLTSKRHIRYNRRLNPNKS